ncbi:hypothetical protein AHAS_Ahas19G0054900 [Arachis hypogaea]
MATVYRKMSQEKKDIMEEMGFGALAKVPEMNGRIYITPQKVAAALGIANEGNLFSEKVNYNNLNPADKECAGYECRRGGEPEKIQEEFCCLHTKVLLAPHNGVENKRNGKKQSIDGYVFVLILIYFHETKFPRPFAPDAPPGPWVAHWTKEMIIDRISSEATQSLKGKKKEKTKTSNLDKKEKGKKIKKKIVETDSSSEEERLSESESESQVPTVNMDSEQLLQTQGSSTPSVNAVNNTRSVQEELMKDDFIYVPPQEETQQTSNNDCPQEAKKHGVTVSLTSFVIDDLFKDDYVYEVSNEEPLEQQQQPCKELTAQQSKQEAHVDLNKFNVLLSLDSLLFLIAALQNLKSRVLRGLLQVLLLKMFRGLPETGGRSRTRSSVLVGDGVSGWLVAAGAVVSDLLDLLHC